MTDERQSRGAGFWATVALVAALAYPASMGPVCWMSSRSGCCVGVVTRIYKPLFQSSYSRERGLIQKGLDWYACLGAKDGWCWIRAEFELERNGILMTEIIAEWIWGDVEIEGAKWESNNRRIVK